MLFFNELMREMKFVVPSQFFKFATTEKQLMRSVFKVIN